LGYHVWAISGVDEVSKYVFGTKTAKQQIMDRFKSEDEAVKASVMKKNKKMWVEIRGEVKEWMVEVCGGPA